MMNSYFKGFVILAATSSLLVLLLTVNLCPRKSCSVSNFLRKDESNRGNTFRTTQQPRIYRFTREDIKTYNFTNSKTDVIVFLHIQKTGGTTFGRHLVQNLNMTSPCQCKRSPSLRCFCKRPVSNKIWLFSRYSQGWPCGLHADWTELQACVPGYIKKRNGIVKDQRYLYVTFLREPISRVLSEFRCYQRGTTWAASLHKCKGRKPTNDELPPCYTGETWEDVTMDEFIGCKSNLAFNRQVRMTADLTRVNCYNQTGFARKKRDKSILKSAMRNLQSMAYFGLVEYQQESQYLFEKTFDMKFNKPFKQKDQVETRAADVMTDIEQKHLDQIKKLNSNDLRFYRFAKELFFYRLKYFQDRDKVNN